MYYEVLTPNKSTVLCEKRLLIGSTSMILSPSFNLSMLLIKWPPASESNLDPLYVHQNK